MEGRDWIILRLSAPLSTSVGESLDLASHRIEETIRKNCPSGPEELCLQLMVQNVEVLERRIEFEMTIMAEESLLKQIEWLRELLETPPLVCIIH